MSDNKLLSRAPSLRLGVIFVLFMGLYVLALINLYVLQIIQNRYFDQLGKQQYFVTATIKPPRAEIYDRHGVKLAENENSFSAFIIPNQLEEPQKLKKFLKVQYPGSLERLTQHKKAPFMYIKRRLTQEQCEKIEKSGLKDIKILKEPSRFYPLPAVAPVVGMTDIDNNGVLGLEYLYNEKLSGEPSVFVLEKDARSGHFYFKQQTTFSGNAPEPIRLTLDGELQALVFEDLKDTVQELGSSEGSVLIVNPDTGEILVMATYPSFDPQITEKLDLERTRNRIVSDAYEFGSVIKAFSAIAALEEGVVTPEELIDCEGKKETWFNGVRISTWKAHGVISFSEVIQGSNNIGVAKVTQRVGSKLYDHYTRLGFGQKVGLLPNEHKGFVNNPKNWTRASLISLSFGYEISATLMQLARAFSVIVNDGYMVPLRLVLNQKEEKKRGPLYSERALGQMNEILRKTISDGTATQAKIEGCEVRGKTGTGRLLVNGTYQSNKNIFTFMSVIQKGNYRRIIITFIKETEKKNVYASQIAVPLFEKVAHRLLIYDKLCS